MASETGVYNRKTNSSMVLRINMQKQDWIQESVPAEWERLGGRGLIAKILLDGIPPTCDPLGVHNLLIFAPGLLVGHKLSSCDRISIGCKSPLTGGVKEANAGGTTGLCLALLGIKALILEEQSPQGNWWLLRIHKNGVDFDDASPVVGKGVYETAKFIQEKYGSKVAVSLIGPGGEMCLRAAGIQNLDQDGVPSRIAARGGVGAVMGCKGIKAIIFDPKGCSRPHIADPLTFKAAQKVFTEAVLAHPQSAVYRDYGTAAMTRMSNGFGALPTRNFSSGQFEQAEALSGERMRQVLIERGGESNPTHACMPGCAIRCSNVYGDSQGKRIVSPLEYETIGLMGSNLGISDLDTIAHLNWVVNDLGLDSIEIGAALGVAIEGGLAEYGNDEKMLALLQEIRKGSPVGRMIGNGAVTTGQVLGVRRVPAVKGQAMSAYEPRAIKGTGVTYATSPQGADHTSGLTIRAKVDHLDPKVQVEVSRKAQINNAGYDTLGACIFAGFGFSMVPDVIRDLLNARYGWQVGSDILQVLGKETLMLEREFNRKAGFTSTHDRLPEWMTEEPLPPNESVFDVSSEDLDSIFNW